ncbi:hypothetical protein BLNAU_10942 [Blattamonas nauphoetae]|uniref:Uncharacterized protein n=1 Tax=Blattamonas nauphoetae TaxID=2049346 RepID=A0ABQ9XR84_9EUKA|nr:hypothetical protein BLNAU_10942 [Blattamonas nauphoetae]
MQPPSSAEHSMRKCDICISGIHNPTIAGRCDVCNDIRTHIALGSWSEQSSITFEARMVSESNWMISVGGRGGEDSERNGRTTAERSGAAETEGSRKEEERIGEAASGKGREETTGGSSVAQKDGRGTAKTRRRGQMTSGGGRVTIEGGREEANDGEHNLSNL